ncbi:hypothetical protein NDU88_011112 [Pleurodeles waltl]|uniref:Uncharacterized protein n=1 Tax=Pleurodeles waltl TaxID=8319 RepID=A0AAV7PXJ3_PLEWA|nr:hypothetical protein NDU88_011112 [Pleurodeles waltl]
MEAGWLEDDGDLEAERDGSRNLQEDEDLEAETGGSRNLQEDEYLEAERDGSRNLQEDEYLEAERDGSRNLQEDEDLEAERNGSRNLKEDEDLEAESGACRLLQKYMVQACGGPWGCAKGLKQEAAGTDLAVVSGLGAPHRGQARGSSFFFGLERITFPKDIRSLGFAASRCDAPSVSITQLPKGALVAECSTEVAGGAVVVRGEGKVAHIVLIQL